MDQRIVMLHKAAANRPDVIGLAGGLPADELLPHEDLARALAAVARSRHALQYGWPEGAAELRAWIARRLTARGAAIDPGRVIVTAGAQQALAIAATLLRADPAALAAHYPTAARDRASISPAVDSRYPTAARDRAPLPTAARDRPAWLPVEDVHQHAMRSSATLDDVNATDPEPAVAIDVGDATYPGALDAFARAGIRIARGATCGYTIAGVSNPHGIALAPPRCAGPLIVDEAYVELRFDGHVATPLVGDDVWHVGTIAKALAPGLRIGWLIAPRRRHESALELKHADDLQAASVSQAALVELLATFDYDAHLAKVRALYETRAGELTEALHRHVDGIHFAPPEGGFSIWVETDDRGDELALLRTALAEGVMFDPGGAFSPTPRETIAARLSFSNAPSHLLGEAARRFARALARWRRRR